MTTLARIDPTASGDPAVQAIASVLQAERDAQLAVAQTQATADRIVDAARADARRVADRCERRSRSVATAFERSTADRLAVIDQQAAALARPQALDDTEAARLTAAVQRLARALTGNPP